GAAEHLPPQAVRRGAGPRPRLPDHLHLRRPALPAKGAVGRRAAGRPRPDLGGGRRRRRGLPARRAGQEEVRALQRDAHPLRAGRVHVHPQQGHGELRHAPHRALTTAVVDGAACEAADRANVRRPVGAPFMPTVGIRWRMVAALLGLICVATSGAVLVVLHFLPTGLDPIRYAVSDYGWTAYHLGYRAMVLLQGAGAILIAVGLGQETDAQA